MITETEMYFEDNDDSTPIKLSTESITSNHLDFSYLLYLLSYHSTTEFIDQSWCGNAT